MDLSLVNCFMKVAENSLKDYIVVTSLCTSLRKFYNMNFIYKNYVKMMIFAEPTRKISILIMLNNKLHSFNNNPAMYSIKLEPFDYFDAYYNEILYGQVNHKLIKKIAGPRKTTMRWYKHGRMHRDTYAPIVKVRSFNEYLRFPARINNIIYIRWCLYDKRLMGRIKDMIIAFIGIMIMIVVVVIF